MPLIIPSNSISTAAGYTIDNSLRFDDGSNDNLNRTPSSTGDQQKFTFSFWVKKTNNSNQLPLFSTYRGSHPSFNIVFSSTNGLWVYYYDGGYQFAVFTSQVFRDHSAWYHVVLAVDTTQATASDRLKFYVNGTQITSFTTDPDGNGTTYPSLNYNTNVNTTTAHEIGSQLGINYFDGYMSEVVLIDGQQLDATSFGEFDEDSGIWKPIDVSGLTFGTNGFYLDFENSGSLGADVSGNGNNFTVNNLTSIDQTTDTPTNNFATGNPLETDSVNVTFSDGNCTQTAPSGGNSFTTSTQAVSQGKWYVEMKWVSGTDTSSLIGFSTLRNEGTPTPYLLRLDGTLNNLTASGVAPSGFSAGEIVGMALDLDNDRVQFYIDGVADGDDCTFSRAADELVVLAFGSQSHTANINYGNPTFTISSGNSDANGYGNFEYAVPSGYYALNTKNLAEYG